MIYMKLSLLSDVVMNIFRGFRECSVIFLKIKWFYKLSFQVSIMMRFNHVFGVKIIIIGSYL